MRRPFRRAQLSVPPRDGWFAAWLVRQFSHGTPTAALPYDEVERLCANAGSLLVGAAYSAPARFHGHIQPSPHLGHEADLVSRRTADGFKASLADRKNAVIAWPWDHMATSIAWEASRSNDTSEETLGLALLDLAGSYATRHRDQITAVLDLWQQIAAGVHAGADKPDLGRMGVDMLDAFEAVKAAGG